jgi:hypothetical protein
MGKGGAHRFLVRSLQGCFDKTRPSGRGPRLLVEASTTSTLASTQASPHLMLSKLPRAAARARLAAQPACRARSSIASRASRASRLPRFPPRDSDAPRPDAARRARSSIAPAESSIADPASLTWSPPSEPEPPSSLLPLWLVHRARALLPVIGHSAYITLASGFLMTDVLALRLMLIGGYSGLVAFHALHERPLRIPFRWSVFFVVVNGVMALKLVRDRYPGAFGEEEESIYEGSFTQLSRGQFKRLMALATAAPGDGPSREAAPVRP